MTSYESAILLAKALDSKKGQDIKVLRTEGLTTLADYFVICTAGSSTQIKAMSDACEETMEKHGEQAHHIEGHRGGTWLLMDFSDVVVHVFTDEARKFYDLVAAIAAGVRAAVWYGNVGSCGRSRGNDGARSRGGLFDGHSLDIGMAPLDGGSLNRERAGLGLVGNGELAGRFIDAHALGLGSSRNFPIDRHCCGGRAVIINTCDLKRPLVGRRGIGRCRGDSHLHRRGDIDVDILQGLIAGLGEGRLKCEGTAVISNVFNRDAGCIRNDGLHIAGKLIFVLGIQRHIGGVLPVGRKLSSASEIRSPSDAAGVVRGLSDAALRRAARRGLGDGNGQVMGGSGGNSDGRGFNVNGIAVGAVFVNTNIFGSQGKITDLACRNRGLNGHDLGFRSHVTACTRTRCLKVF